MKLSNKILFVIFIIILLIILILSILGIFLMREKEIVLQGQIEAEEYNISGLLPGRIENIYVKKGSTVNKGDTLVHIISQEVIAEYEAQKALENAASLQSDKIDSGSRKELISIAKELWDGTKADLKLAKTTYNRIKVLYEDSIVSKQRRDEAEAIYKSALAAERAAYYQYQIAVDGAQKQDKESARAMATAAQNNRAIKMRERYLRQTARGVTSFSGGSSSYRYSDDCSSTQQPQKLFPNRHHTGTFQRSSTGFKVCSRYGNKQTEIFIF